jgi:hypothetical protein
MEDIWFDNAAVGKNTPGDKMKILSQKYNLSAVYTNHSLRATTITMLDNEGYEAAQRIISYSVQSPTLTFCTIIFVTTVVFR